MSLTKSTLLALVVFALPLASQAAPGPSAALDACVKSFLETYLPNHPVKQIRKRIPTTGPIDAFYGPRQYTIALSAQGVRSGDVLAEARCVANSKGIVIVLDSPAAGEYVARADFAVTLR